MRAYTQLRTPSLPRHLSYKHLTFHLRYRVLYGREKVSNELRQVLQEKENLLNEAASLFREAESVHSARREAFLAEKADMEADLEVSERQTLFSPPCVFVGVGENPDKRMLSCCTVHGVVVGPHGGTTRGLMKDWRVALTRPSVVGPGIFAFLYTCVVVRLD